MVKADIVKRLASSLNMKDKDALFVVDQILDALKGIILEERRLEIRDFGVFQVKERKPRTGRNPKNKVEYPIPPHKVVTFKPGKELKLLPNAPKDGHHEDDAESDV
jgi:nucleoid DNA-binding protein